MGRTKAMGVAVALAITLLLAVIGGGWHWVSGPRLKARAVPVSVESAPTAMSDGWAW